MANKHVEYIAKKLNAAIEDGSPPEGGGFSTVYNYRTGISGKFEDDLVARWLASGCKTFRIFVHGEDLTIIGT